MITFSLLINLICIHGYILSQWSVKINFIEVYSNPNTHSINCTAITAAVPELLHSPIHYPQTSQIQFLEEASTGQCVKAIP